MIIKEMWTHKNKVLSQAETQHLNTDTDDGWKHILTWLSLHSQNTDQNGCKWSSVLLKGSERRIMSQISTIESFQNCLDRAPTCCSSPNTARALWCHLVARSRPTSRTRRSALLLHKLPNQPSYDSELHNAWYLHAHPEVTRGMRRRFLRACTCTCGHSMREDKQSNESKTKCIFFHTWFKF